MVTPSVVAHWVRSGKVGLSVVTAALDADPRTTGADTTFATSVDETARAIDQEVGSLLEERYAQARQIVRDHREALELVAKELLQHEVLDGSRFRHLAQLGASGTTLPDTLMLTAADQPQSSFGIFLQHDALDDRVFHDGVLCGGGTMIRLRTRTAVGGVTEFPNSSDTITLSQRGQVLPGSGATRYYSLFYRNASTTFCPPATANGTNGVRVRW